MVLFGKTGGNKLWMIQGLTLLFPIVIGGRTNCNVRLLFTFAIFYDGLLLRRVRTDRNLMPSSVHLVQFCASEKSTAKGPNFKRLKGQKYEVSKLWQSKIDGWPCKPCLRLCIWWLGEEG
jgi:hypothetical protein